MDDQSHPPAPTPYLNQTHQYEQTNHKVTMQDQLHRELEAAKYLRAQHLARIDLVTHKIAKITNSYDSQAASSIRSQRRQELQTINNQIKRNNRDTLHIQTEIEQESNPYLEEQTMIQEKIETNISKQETLDIEITTLHEALDRQRRIRSNLEKKTKDVLYLLQQSDQAYQHKQNNAIQKEEEKKRIQETLTEKRKDSDHYMKQTEEKSTASAVLRTRLKKIEKTSMLNRNITQKHDTKEYKAIKLKERKILEMKKLIEKDEKEKQLLINNNNSLKEENHMMLLTAEEHERNNNEFSNRTIDLQQDLSTLQVSAREQNGMVAALKRELANLSNSKLKEEANTSKTYLHIQQMNEQLSEYQHEIEVQETIKMKQHRKLNSLTVSKINVTGEIETIQDQQRHLLTKHEILTIQKQEQNSKIDTLTLELSELENLNNQARLNKEKNQTLVNTKSKKVSTLEKELQTLKLAIDAMQRSSNNNVELARLATKEKNLELSNLKSMTETFQVISDERKNNSIQEGSLIVKAENKIQTLEKDITLTLHATAQMKAQKAVYSNRTGTVRGIQGNVSSRIKSASANSSVAGAFSDKIHLKSISKNKHFRHATKDALELFLQVSRENTKYNSRQTDISLRYPFRKWYRTGQHLFQQGDTQDNSKSGRVAYIVLEGHCNVQIQDSKSGKSKNIKTLSPGSVVGEFGLFGDGSGVRTAGCIVTGGSRCLVIEFQRHELKAKGMEKVLQSLRPESQSRLEKGERKLNRYASSKNVGGGGSSGKTTSLDLFP